MINKDPPRALSARKDSHSHLQSLLKRTGFRIFRNPSPVKINQRAALHHKPGLHAPHVVAVPLVIMLRASQKISTDSAEEKEHVKIDRVGGGPL